MILDHVENTQLLRRNELILLGVLFGHLRVKTTTLASNLQMRLGCALCSLTASMTALLSSANHVLLASERTLRIAIEMWVLNNLALTISQEGLQPHINADCRLLTSGRCMLGVRLSLTDDEGIPMSVSTTNQVSPLAAI